jgi:hypothetical protein
LEGAMTEQSKKRFFDHWISEYCNRLEQVATHKKAAVELQGSLTSPAIDLPSKPRTMRVAEPTAKTQLNRFHQ